MRFPRDVYLHAAEAVTGYGLGGPGLAARLRAGPAAPTVTIPESEDAGDGRQRKLMSQAARLAAIAMRRALAAARFTTDRMDLAELGAYFGVGASGGTLTELSSLTAASRIDDRFDLRRFGEQGLQACNPLLAFRLMNNFSLCHGSILAGLGGPNGAWFSRGGGTVTAIMEAAWALCEGECERAITGGSDCAHSALTLAELRRAGALELGVGPAEAAAAVALSTVGEGALARLCAATLVPPPQRPGSVELATLLPATLAPPDDQLAAALSLSAQHELDAALFLGWSTQARATLRSALSEQLQHAEPIDVTASLGETLAAGPAVGLVAAADLIASEGRRRVALLSASIDGDISMLILEAP